VKKFEQAARQLLALEIPPDAKANRLNKLCTAIQHYTERLDAELTRRRAAGDQRTSAAIVKVKAHLDRLADDSRRMASTLAARARRGVSASKSASSNG
jgi:hypothetical protein